MGVMNILMRAIMMVVIAIILSIVGGFAAKSAADINKLKKENTGNENLKLAHAKMAGAASLGFIGFALVVVLIIVLVLIGLPALAFAAKDQLRSFKRPGGITIVGTISALIILALIGIIGGVAWLSWKSLDYYKKGTTGMSFTGEAKENNDLIHKNSKTSLIVSAASGGLALFALIIQMF